MHITVAEDTTPSVNFKNGFLFTGKNFLVEIKTGLPWDNDFLFESNNNYQSTRRDIELKVSLIFKK